MIKKYKLICKKDYTEVLSSDVVNTYLFKGICYDIEELWNTKGDIMRNWKR